MPPNEFFCEIHLFFWRHIIIILIVIFCVYTFGNKGTVPIDVPYAKAAFEWEHGTQFFTQEYAKIQCMGNMLVMFAIGVLLPVLTQVLKCPDPNIIALGIVSSFLGISMILIAGAQHDYRFLYLAWALRMCSEFTDIGIRSMSTKLAGPQDVGKVKY